MPYVRHILEAKGSDVATVSPDDTVLAAAELMNARRIGAVVVMENDRVVGIFTERDILNRVVAAQRDAAQTRVREVMTHPVACCTPETHVAECQRVMTQKRIRHLPVVEGERLVGIISSGDLLAQEVSDQRDTIRYLTDYLHGRR